MRVFEKNYRINEGDDVLAKENAIHQDVDLRLDAVEQLGKAFAEGNRVDIEAIIRAYQDRVAGLAAQVDSIIDAATGGLAARFSSTSSTPVNVGTGLQTFVVPAADRPSFSPAAYLGISLTVDARIGMTGLLESFDRTTGVLVVHVTTAAGGGVHAGWTISACPPPMVPTVIDGGFDDDAVPDDYSVIPFVIEAGGGPTDGGTF